MKFGHGRGEAKEGWKNMRCSKCGSAANSAKRENHDEPMPGPGEHIILLIFADGGSHNLFAGLPKHCRKDQHHQEGTC